MCFGVIEYFEWNCSARVVAAAMAWSSERGAVAANAC